MWGAKYKLLFALPIIIISLLAFTNDILCVAGEVQDISNPAKAPTERKWEFKSSDLLVLSVLVDGKYLDALVLKRKIN